MPCSASRVLPLLLVLLLAAPPPSVYAQVGVAALEGLTINMDPFSRALGEATVARRGYPGAASVNPASIGRSGTAQLSSTFTAGGVGNGAGAFFRTAWLPRFSTDDWVANPAVDVALGRWAVGYRYNRIDINPPQDSRVLPSQYEQAHSLTVAYAVTAALSVGVGISRLEDYNSGAATVGAVEAQTVRATSFDLGALYTRELDTAMGTWPVSVGWSLTDFGAQVERPGGFNAAPLPTMMRGGISAGYYHAATWLGRTLVGVQVDLALSKLTIRTTADENGMVTADGPVKALFTTWQPLTVRTGNTDADVFSLSVWDQLRRQHGISVTLLEAVHLRAGRFWEHERNGARQYNSVGWGLDLYYLTLDYSRILDDDTPLAETAFWRFGARVPLTVQARGDNPWRGLWQRLKR